MFPRIALVLVTLLGPRAAALTLADALAEARRSDAALAASRSDEDAARDALKSAWSTWLPALRLQQRFTRLDAATVGRANAFLDFVPATPVPGDSLPPPTEPQGGTLDYEELRVFRDSHRTELELSWPVITGGARLGAIRMAGGARDLSIERERLEARRAELETRTAFLSALRARQTIEVLQANVGRVDAYLRAARGRRRAGKATELDVLRWEVGAEEARADLAEARAGLAAARATLERLLGRSLDLEEAIEPLVETRDLPELVAIERVLDDTAAGAPRSWSDVLESDAPAVRGAEAARRIASGAVRVATAPLLPSFALGASYGWQSNETLGLDGYREWNASAILSLPLLPLATGYFDRAEARARVAAEGYRVEQARRSTREELLSRTAWLRAAAIRRDHAGKGIEAARMSLAAAERGSARGVVSRLELEDARVALLETELGEISARTNYHIEAAGLGFLLGYSALSRAVVTQSDRPEEGS